MKNAIKIRLVGSKYLLILVKLLMKVIKRNLEAWAADSGPSFRVFSNFSRQLGYYPGSHIFDNNLYGIEHTLKEFSNKEGTVNCYIEHGLFFGDHIQQDEASYYTTRIITFGESRIKHLNNRLPSKNALAIGPYIHYARTIKLPFINLRNGKTLLFFPNHSTSSLISVQNIDNNISFLIKLKSKYGLENIVISLYYLDIDEDITRKYRRAGFQLFTAGSKWDQNFLNRLRTMIEKSHLTVSSSVGTHVGYCTYLGKPHTIVKLKEKIVENKNHQLIKNVIASEKGEKRLSEINEIEREFVQSDKMNLHTSISLKQYSVCQKYWGFNYVKKKEELYNLL